MKKLDIEYCNQLLAWVYVFGGGNEALTHNEMLVLQVKEATKRLDMELLKDYVSELCLDYNVMVTATNMPSWCDFNFAQNSKQKETGAFYTPIAIVSYLSQQTVFCWFSKNGFPMQEIQDLKNYESADVLDALHSLTILEPSCGTGAFCVGILQTIKDILFEIECDTEIQNIFPIYGKDINNIAVEMSSLRVKLFYLLNDTDEDVFNEKMDKHFVCENTLTIPTSGGGLFGEKDFQKYHIVIGNPPYIQIQKLKEEQKELEKQGLETYAKNSDLYCLFYEKGVLLLKEKGILGFITSNKWMRAGYGEKLRNFFNEKTNPLLLIDFAGVQVFGTATVDTNTLILENSENKQELMAMTMTKEMWKEITTKRPV